MSLPPFQLERFFAKHEFTAPYLICCSDCESVSLKEILDLEPDSRDRFDKLWMGYSESMGHPELRKAIATHYREVPASGILAHTGAEEAIYNFMQTQVRKGDRVVVHWPCYQSLAAVAESLGAEVIRWEASPERGWELDLNFLEATLQKPTRVVVVNLPHNPTGYLMEEGPYRELVKLVEKSGAILFLDEVYRGLEYSPSFQLPSACDLSETAISLGVMSKAYGLAGLRIGWIATRNRQVFDAMSAFKDYTTICNSAPSEWLTTLALRHREKFLDRNRALIEKNLVLLDDFFAHFSDRFQWVRPRAGCLAFPRLRTGSAEAFCEEVLKKSGVLLAPSSQFLYGDRHFRLGFGRANFSEALQKFSSAC